ncbi:ABC transporter ATP-binding protein [Mycetocola sp. 2940]|uniref:ABC transporter ATP-binding protein n=1 Tax=Mycetocola sp. 2940 TaxID=3156452 RepID=UPI0033971BF2
MSQDVDVIDLNLTLGGNRILTDVNLTVAAGSFVTLLGPSGSGKSTTLNVIAGFLKPDVGRVQFGGRDVLNLPPGARQLGIVFQNYAIFPHMSVGENVEFPLLAQRWQGDRRKRVAEVLELVKLGGFLKRRASTLSGGQLQRVALARALAAGPQVLLLDEPLSALDKQLREAMQTELKQIQREVGVTTISVTHDQSEALSMSDQVVVMNQGRVEQSGTAEEMYSRPASEFLARFLGEVNLFPVDSRGTARPLARLVPEHAGRMMMARPEDFTIAELGGTGSDRFAATVVQCQFQGGTCRIEAKVNGLDDPIIIRTPYGGLGSVLLPGQSITVTYDWSYIHSVPSNNPVHETGGIPISTSARA